MKTSDDYVEVWHAADGWRWHRKSANHEIVSESGEAYDHHQVALTAAATLNEGYPIHDIDKEH